MKVHRMTAAEFERAEVFAPVSLESSGDSACTVSWAGSITIGTPRRFRFSFEVAGSDAILITGADAKLMLIDSIVDGIAQVQHNALSGRVVNAMATLVTDYDERLVAMERRMLALEAR